MKVERIYELLKMNSADSLKFDGECADCGRAISIIIEQKEDGFEITGGAVYETEYEDFTGKCQDCYGKDNMLRNYRECEVYSRVVGYLRPVSQWNPGKQAEFKDRKMFDRKDMEND